MSSPAVRSATPGRLRNGQHLRVAFVGPTVWLDGCAPTSLSPGLASARFPTGERDDCDSTLASIERFGPHATVVFDPPVAAASLLSRLPGITLGILVNGVPELESGDALECLHRLACFDPALTGSTIGGREVWRAIPPPVGDSLFADVRALHRVPRAISIGRSTAHREAMLMPAKHNNDLLQVIHGVSGEPLQELLREFDVGVFVAREDGGGFGLQVGIHLASGQLLLAEELKPAHGLERDIDYLHIHAPEDARWVLDRLARFPEMYQRVRVRGRLKAETFRASSVFRRLAHDVLHDVAAFGTSRSGSEKEVACRA